MVERLHCRPFEEAHQQSSTRADRARELGERDPDVPRPVVDQRIPGKDPTERFACGVQCFEAAVGEREVRILRPCAADELRNEVDARGRRSAPGQEVRPLSRPATCIEHGTAERLRPVAHEGRSDGCVDVIEPKRSMYSRDRAE